MLVGFPDAVPAIDGDISPMKLLRFFRHLIKCAQSTTTSYHELKVLFLVVPPSGWLVYGNGPRPTNLIRPGTKPLYIDGNAVNNQMIKDQWAVNKTYFEEDKNMNKALTERFLELVPVAQRQGYKDILVGCPNRRFETTFAYFYDNYGREDEIEIENNKDKMKAELHPRDSFEVSKQRIKDGMMYVRRVCQQARQPRRRTQHDDCRHHTHKIIRRVWNHTLSMIQSPSLLATKCFQGGFGDFYNFSKQSSSVSVSSFPCR